MQLRTALEGKPASQRNPADYKKVINKYRSVYYLYPTSPQADDALVAVAELYQLMASDQKSPGDFEQAIKTYRFLIKEYPGSPYRTDALYAIGEIYLNDLKDTATAEEVFREFIEKHPHSIRAKRAKARLNDLHAQLKQSQKSTGKSNFTHEKPSQVAISSLPGSESEKAQTPANPDKDTTQGNPRDLEPKAQAAAKSLALLNSKKTISASDAKQSASSDLPTEDTGLKVLAKTGTRNSSAQSAFNDQKIHSINELRYWNTENYTRVIIVSDGELRFQEGRLEDPARYFIDIGNARISSSFSAKTFPIKDGYLNQIRLGQLKDQVCRIVLDLGETKTCSISTLHHPPRIVIDITGPPRLPLLAGKKEWHVQRGEPLPDELEHPSIARKTPSGELNKSVPQKDSSLAGVQTSKSVATAPALDGEPLAAAKAPHAQPKARNQAGNPAPLVARQEPEAKPKVAAPKSDGTRSLTRTLGLKIGRIVIDPGHGGHDTGTVGPSGLQEKDLVLDISMRLKALVETKLDGEVTLTRTEDVFVPLEERTAIANQTQADLFISIHANSSRNKRVSGVETFFLNFASSPEVEEIAARENASSQKTVFELQDLVQKITLREKVDESKEFAQLVQKSVCSSLSKPRTPKLDRGVKQAPFIVLIGANMPSILSEISFVSNPADEKLLKSSVYRQKIAEALCDGIASYAGNLGGIKTAKIIP
ncbi:MAG: N-acetylmuramoyl-L-alanine amidase [Terriglobia bacterium]